MSHKYNQTAYTLVLSWHKSMLPLSDCSSLLVGLSAPRLPYDMSDRVDLLKLRQFMLLLFLKSCKDFISLSWSYSLSLYLNYLPVSPHSLGSALLSLNTPTKLRPYPSDLSIFDFLHLELWAWKFPSLLSGIHSNFTYPSRLPCPSLIHHPFSLSLTYVILW